MKDRVVINTCKVCYKCLITPLESFTLFYLIQGCSEKSRYFKILNKKEKYFLIFNPLNFQVFVVIYYNVCIVLINI
jgi:hypothetical protein